MPTIPARDAVPGQRYTTRGGDLVIAGDLIDDHGTPLRRVKTPLGVSTDLPADYPLTPEPPAWLAELIGAPREELEPKLEGLTPTQLDDLLAADPRPWLAEHVQGLRTRAQELMEATPDGGASLLVGAPTEPPSPGEALRILDAARRSMEDGAPDMEALFSEIAPLERVEGLEEKVRLVLGLLRGGISAADMDRLQALLDSAIRTARLIKLGARLEPAHGHTPPASELVPAPAPAPTPARPRPVILQPDEPPIGPCRVCSVLQALRVADGGTVLPAHKGLEGGYCMGSGKPVSEHPAYWIRQQGGACRPCLAQREGPTMSGPEALAQVLDAWKGAKPEPEQVAVWVEGLGRWRRASDVIPPAEEVASPVEVVAEPEPAITITEQGPVDVEEVDLVPAAREEPPAQDSPRQEPPHEEPTPLPTASPTQSPLWGEATTSADRIAIVKAAESIDQVEALRVAPGDPEVQASVLRECDSQRAALTLVAEALAGGEEGRVARLRELGSSKRMSRKPGVVAVVLRELAALGEEMEPASTVTSQEAQALQADPKPPEESSSITIGDGVSGESDDGLDGLARIQEKVLKDPPAVTLIDVVNAEPTHECETTGCDGSGVDCWDPSPPPPHVLAGLTWPQWVLSLSLMDAEEAVRAQEDEDLLMAAYALLDQRGWSPVLLSTITRRWEAITGRTWPTDAADPNPYQDAAEAEAQRTPSGVDVERIDQELAQLRRMVERQMVEVAALDARQDEHDSQVEDPIAVFLAGWPAAARAAKAAGLRMSLTLTND